MSGEIIRGVLNEQTLIFTVGKNALIAIPSSPPFFFFKMEIKRFFELTMNKIRGNNSTTFFFN